MAYAVLILGILFLISGLVAAIILDRSEKQAANRSRILVQSYVFLQFFAFVISGLLCMSGSLEASVSVNAYRVLFDLLAVVLSGALITGFVLVIQQRRFIASYGLLVCGVFLTMGEFLGR